MEQNTVLKIATYLAWASLIGILLYWSFKSLKAKWLHFSQENERKAILIETVCASIAAVIAGIVTITYFALNTGITELHCDQNHCILEKRNFLDQPIEYSKIKVTRSLEAEIRSSLSSRRRSFGLFRRSSWLLIDTHLRQTISEGTHQHINNQVNRFRLFLHNPSEGFSYYQNRRSNGIWLLIVGAFISLLGTSLLLFVCRPKNLLTICWSIKNGQRNKRKLGHNHILAM